MTQTVNPINLAPDIHEAILPQTTLPQGEVRFQGGSTQTDNNGLLESPEQAFRAARAPNDFPQRRQSGILPPPHPQIVKF
jgi:hypothetical protein